MQEYHKIETIKATAESFGIKSVPVLPIWIYEYCDEVNHAKIF